MRRTVTAVTSPDGTAAAAAGALSGRSGKALAPLDEPGSPEKATERQSVFTMVNAVLGAGVLGYPFCYKACGLALATLLVLVTLSASELSMRLLMVASQMAGKRSYPDLAAHCFGRAGRSAVDLCITVMNLGSLVAYLNILADMFSLVANTVIPPGAEPSRNMLLAAITLGAALPVALFVKSPRLLSLVSQASVAFIFFFSLMTGLMALAPAPTPGGLALWEPSGVLVAFPVIVYGFTAHQVLFSIYGSLRSASVTRMTGVIQKSMLLSTLVYLLVGACGYIAFGQRTAGDVLRNFGGPTSTGPRLAFERFLKVGYGVSILGTVPLIVMPLQSPFAAAVGLKLESGSAYVNPSHEHFVTSLIIGLALTLAIAVPNIEYIFGLCGSTVSVLVSFILPAAIYLKVTAIQQRAVGPPVVQGAAGGAGRPGPSTWRQRRRLAAALLLFGALAGGACTQAMLAAVQEEAEVVQLAHELLKEETKVMKANEVQKKANEAQKKVKAVAEAVGAMAEAQRQLNVVQEETHATLGAVLQATQDLHEARHELPGGLPLNPFGKKGKKGMGEVHKDLQAVQERVESAVQTLTNATATLGATASRLRNETQQGAGAANGTLAKLALPADGAVGAGALAVAKEGSAKDGQGSGDGSQGVDGKGGLSEAGSAGGVKEPDGGGSKEGEEVGGGGTLQGGRGSSSQHPEEVEEQQQQQQEEQTRQRQGEEEQQQQQQEQAEVSPRTDNSSSGGTSYSTSNSDGAALLDHVAALDAVANATNATLSRVKESQKALEAVHQAAGKRFRKLERKGALEAVHQAVGKRFRKKEEGVISALEQAVNAMVEAAVDLMKEAVISALQQAVNATVEAAAHVNATVERLKQAEAGKRSELVDVATQLVKEQEEQEAAETRKAEQEDIQRLREGRKAEPGGGAEQEEGSRTAAAAAAAAAGDGGGSSGSDGGSEKGGGGSSRDDGGGLGSGAAAGEQAQQQEEQAQRGAEGEAGAAADEEARKRKRREKREKLKARGQGGREILELGVARRAVLACLAGAGSCLLAGAATTEAASNGTGSLNMTEVLQAATDLAEGAAQDAKANLEQAIEKKKTEVASRAIEIAKELAKESAEGQGLRRAEQGQQQQQQGSSSSSSSDTSSGEEGGAGLAGGGDNGELTGAFQAAAGAAGEGSAVRLALQGGADDQDPKQQQPQQQDASGSARAGGSLDSGSTGGKSLLRI
ncbi:hypothetical protein N2152v2_006609 [Parachlorella kessleri]